MTEAMAEVHSGCGHPFDEHVLYATGSTPMDGGVMLCPVQGCMCFSTWSAPFVKESKRTDIRVPDVDELAAMREVLQS